MPLTKATCYLLRTAQAVSGSAVSSSAAARRTAVGPIRSASARRSTQKSRRRLPAVSPDGKYLFFTRGQDNVHNVYWVDASVIEPLRLQRVRRTNLTGDYLGQKPPGATPQVFARGIVSTERKRARHSGILSGWQRSILAGSRPTGPLAMTMRRENGRWSAPRLSPYPSMPVYSADGNGPISAHPGQEPHAKTDSRTSGLRKNKETAGARRNVLI